MRPYTPFILMATLLSSTALSLGNLGPGQEFRPDGPERTRRSVSRLGFKLGPITTSGMAAGEISFTLYDHGRKIPWYTDELQPARKGDLNVTLLGPARALRQGHGDAQALSVSGACWLQRPVHPFPGQRENSSPRRTLGRTGRA